ncbi:MAG: hypothetical protein CL916_15125 [Deltaproteobacteria bacterium]|nr:hypothetical protein [Deltaproteobacteria bacterium]
MTEKKAKDILNDLPNRDVLGHTMIKKVGRRAWERPNVCISSKLYRIYAIPDPFLPSKEARKWLIGLGPVSLKLGENRRQPAPHLLPKEPPKPKKKTGPNLPNVPKAQTRKAIPKPDPKQDEELKKALEKQKSQGVQRRSTSKPSSDLSAEFGAAPSQHKLARIPVRPDLQSKTGDKPLIQGKKAQVPIQRSIPKPKPQAKRSSNGRIRLQRTNTTSTFKRVDLPQPEQAKKEETPKEKSKQEVKRTSAPKTSNSMGLDDLFGIPSGDVKPMRLRPNRKKK